MAGCYHDQEEFESDLTIEVAREGDILKEGQGLDEFEKCKKNPGHRDFIPFKDLTLEHLPSRYRNTEILDKIKQKGSRVVRLMVGRTLGSGCVYRYRENNQYHIETNNHVVKTEDEVKRCKVEFHYDDDSRSSVITSRGVELIDTDPYRDRTWFTFHPVPDFLHQLNYDNNRDPYVNIMLKNNKIKSRPTLSPSDSYLSDLNLNCSDNYLMFISYPDGSIGYINSCYFKFQPIPSNIKELTSVEVYIDEDDGKSRKIRGDVVKFEDDFVVEVPDSITQDKVKKCRVVWSDKVISRGTQLYFKQCKLKDVYNVRGIDEDICDEDLWQFNFHPKKVSEDRIVPDKHVCCIGHPHGGIKHITFGLKLGETLEKFDNQYRHIKDPRPDCECMEVNCVNYSCKTCPGSSGSPVFRLCDLDGAIYLTHFMGERVKRVINGEQIENINIAWLPGVDMNRMIDERVMNLMKKATRKFEAKIPVAIVSIFNSSDERSNEEAINLMGQYIRELEAKIAVVTASITNSSGEENNEEKINNQLKQAMREFEAKILVAIACIFNSSGERSNEEANNLMRQAISELEAEIAVAAAIAVDRSYFKPF